MQESNLLGELLETTKPAKSPAPLYAELFGDKLQTLREDVEAHPDKYRPELLDVIDGRITDPYLCTSMLSEAVLDFYRPTTPSKAESPPPAERKEDFDPIEEEYLSEDIEDLENLDAFWWIK